MKTIYGRECTLTIFKDNTYTAIPYTSETIRAVTADYALAGTVGKKARLTSITYGQEIAGCIVTRLTDVVTPVVFDLLKENTTPFDILVNRVVDKIMYKNVTVTGFEMRARIDGAVYIRLDIAGTKTSYSTPFDMQTKLLAWEQTRTYFLRDDSFSMSGKVIPSIYLYCLTATFKETIEYELRLHAPLRHNHQLNTSALIERLDYALSSRALMSFFNLVPKNEGNTSDAGGEVLVNRTYRVTGIISITVQQGIDYWSGSL